MNSPQQLQTSIVFKVSKPVCAGKFPDGNDTLWTADVIAERRDVRVETFIDILFVESNDTVFIFGSEEEDGRPRLLNSAAAANQQAFVSYLQQENDQDTRTLGLVAHLFQGRDYATLARATAAYVRAKKKPMRMGISYFDGQGNFCRDSIDPYDGWL